MSEVKNIRFFKESLNRNEIFDPHPISMEEALNMVRTGNKEFSQNKSNESLITDLLDSFIYTNFSRVWAVKCEG